MNFLLIKMCTADIKNHFLECKIEETAININYSKAITHISLEMNNSVVHFDFDKKTYFKLFESTLTTR